MPVKHFTLLLDYPDVGQISSKKRFSLTKTKLLATFEIPIAVPAKAVPTTAPSMPFAIPFAYRTGYFLS